MCSNVLRVLLPVALLLASGAGGTPVRIMPMGDSITHGWYSGIDPNDLDSYRKVLKSLLDTNGYAIDFVGSLTNGGFADNQHEGHDEFHADHPTSGKKLLGNIGGWMASSPADVVLLHIGTNDLNGGDTGTVAEVSAVIDEIFIANSNATIVLAQIIGVKDDPPLQTAISTYNTDLNIMAQARIVAGDDLMVVDMENGAGIDYDSPDMNDRLHPSQIGYDKMATNWFPVTTQAIARQLWRQNGPPHIGSVSAEVGEIVLGITNLVAGLPVGIESTTTLAPAAWSNIFTFTASGTSTNWTEPIATNTLFYRIVGE
ncbi:MAG: GDSL-type esterase/lipase family protein [Verrucomicrobiota bacterium]